MSKHKNLASLAMIAFGSMVMTLPAMAETLAQPTIKPDVDRTITKGGHQDLGTLPGSGDQNLIACVVDSQPKGKAVSFGYVHDFENRRRFQPQVSAQEGYGCRSYSFNVSIATLGVEIENFHIGESARIMVWVTR